MPLCKRLTTENNRLQDENTKLKNRVDELEEMLRWRNIIDTQHEQMK